MAIHLACSNILTFGVLPFFTRAGSHPVLSQCLRTARKINFFMKVLE